jgi:beta-galactosidase
LNKKLTGIQTVSFKVFDKVHIKGFSFERKLRAYEGVGAINAESVYGDSFTQTADAVEGIGNNVTLNFGVLDLGEEGPEKVTITGRAPKNANTIHLRFYNEETGQEYKEILEFPQSKEYTSQTFGINKRPGNWETSFIFLPGSNFDFKAFIFG